MDAKHKASSQVLRQAFEGRVFLSLAYREHAARERMGAVWAGEKGDAFPK